MRRSQGRLQEGRGGRQAAVGEGAQAGVQRKGLAEGKKEGAEAGTKAGYQQGWQDAAARYEQAWDSANPTPPPGTGAVNAPDANSPTP